MSQVRKLKEGGTPITINGIRYNKEEFVLAARDNVDKYADILKLDPTLKELFKQDVEHYIATGETNSANVEQYAKELSLYGIGVSVYLPKIKLKYNGNDYILKNYVLSDYNGDVNLFESDWADNKDESTRRKAFVNYLKKAAADTEHYEDYDFPNSKYKTREEFNNALKSLAEAIEDDDISNDDRSLAYSLGIDIDRWVLASPAKKSESSTTPAEKTDRLLKEEEFREYGRKHLNLSGLKLEDYVKRMLEEYDRNVSKATDELMLALDDSAFRDHYYSETDKYLQSANSYNSKSKSYYDPEGVKVLDQKSISSNSVSADLAYRLSELEKANGTYTPIMYNWAEWIWQRTCANANRRYFIISLHKLCPYFVYVYDGQEHRFKIMGIMANNLNNAENIDRYRQNARTYWQSTRKHKEGGKILKAHYGLTITNTLPLFETTDLQDQSVVQLEDNENWQFEGADYAHMIAAGGDLAALAASFVPGGAVASLAAGIGSAILDTGADFSQVVKGEMSIGSALFNTAVNIGSALLGMVPGGKTASIMLKAAKYIPRIMATLGAMNVAPSIINSFDKLQKNQQLSKEDWLGIVQGIRLLALGIRDLRGIHLNKKYSIGNEGMEIGVSNGKSVKLNRNEAVEYLSLKTDEQKTNWLRSKGKIEDNETVTKSLFGLKSNEKMLGEREFITPREAVRLGYTPSSSSYRYAYTINNRFRQPAKVPVLTQTNNGAPSVVAPAAPSVAAPAAPSTAAPAAPSVVARVIPDARVVRTRVAATRPDVLPIVVPKSTPKSGLYAGTLFEEPSYVQAGNRSGRGYHKEGGKVLKGKTGITVDLAIKDNDEPWKDKTLNPYGLSKYAYLGALDLDSDSNKLSDNLFVGENFELNQETGQYVSRPFSSNIKPDFNLPPVKKQSDEQPDDKIDVTYPDYLKQTPDTLSDDLGNAINIGKDTALGTVILAIKDISKMGNNLTASYHSAPRKESLYNNVYGITRKYQELKNLYYNANARQTTSSAEVKSALDSEAFKNIGNIGIQEALAISTAENSNNTSLVNTGNENRIAEAANANANQDKATALYNQGIMKGMLEHQAIIQAKLNRLYEQIGDLEKKKMTRDAKLGDAWNARQRYMDSAWTLADLLKLELDRISKINEIYENGHKSDPTYTLEKAVKDWESLYSTQYNLNKQNLQRPLEYYHALLNLGIGEWNIPDVGAKVFLPDNGLYQNLYSRTMSTNPNNPDYVGIYLPSWVRNGVVTPIRKSGGSLSYAERKALLDDKLAYNAEKLRKKLMYDDYKTTKIINAKAKKEALKIFADVNNATVKEIFKLINKAVGI